jgi:hypothetical protein
MVYFARVGVFWTGKLVYPQTSHFHTPSSFNHNITHPIPLPPSKHSQQLPHNPRTLIRLLLNLTLTDRVERTEKPHFLQMADEHL